MTVKDPSLNDRIAEAVQVQAGFEPDLYFVCEDGRKVAGHRSVLVLHSKLLESVLLSYPAHLTASLQIPGARYPTICSLVSLLYTGQCVPGSDLHNITSLCRDVLQIDLRVTEEQAQAQEDMEDSEDPLGDSNSVPSLEISEVQSLAVTEEKVVPGPGPKLFKTKTESPGSLQSPNYKEGKMLNCQICKQASFPRLVQFQDHLATQHFSSELTISYGGKHNTCKLCGSKFVSEEKLAGHLGVQHNKVLELYPKKVSTLIDSIVGKYGVNDIQCNLCQIKFKNKQLLATHIGAVHRKLEEFLHDEKQQE